MEYLPGTPFESSIPPDSSGDKEVSKKKKKKTTRIPLPIKKTEVTDIVDGADVKKDAPITLESLFLNKNDNEEDLVDKDDSNDTEHKGEDIAFSHEITEGEIEGEGELVIERLQTDPKELIEGQIEATDELGENEPDDINLFESNDNHPPEVIDQAEDTQPTETNNPNIESVEVSTPESFTPSEEDSEPLPEPDYHKKINPNQRDVSPEVTSPTPQETSKPITERDLDDAYHKGRKRGNSNGVAAGALFGWWIGRRGKRKAELKSEQAIKQRDAEIANMSTEQIYTQDRLKAVERTQKHLEEAISQQDEKITERQAILKGDTYQATTAKFEKPTNNNTNETSKQKTEKAVTPDERITASEAIESETYHAPNDRRVETSAWHRYEVDKKTGKLIQDPELAYGEEFKKEQKQELLLKKNHDQAIASTVGSTVLFGASTNTTTSQSNKQTDQKNKKQKPSLRKVLSDTNYIKQQLVRRTMNPLTWLIAFLIFAFLLLVGVF